MEQIKEIQEKFNRVISYSQQIEGVKTDYLFDQWREAKRDFIEKMNGELIWEWPEEVTFELSKKDRDRRITDFIDMIYDRWNNEVLANFMEEQREGFFSNRVVEEYKDFDADIYIPEGMKLLKAFKYFEDSDLILNEIQSAASMIIQEDKVKGKLCFSVHPLDYLSASENNHNWRSCHALDGEYRSGNLSYMVDKCTVCVYLKSNREEKLPNFPEDVPWNSKKWRVWLYFSNDWRMLFLGRQYPFSTEVGADFLKDRVLPAMGFEEWMPWTKKRIGHLKDGEYEYCFSEEYIPVGTELVPMRELVINKNGSLQFNDLLSSSTYIPYYSHKNMETNKRRAYYIYRQYDYQKTTFEVGGKCSCVKCGRMPIELSETFMCTDCELEFGSSESDTFAWCSCCGRRYIYDDGVWLSIYGDCVCPQCGDTEIKTCEECGEVYYLTDTILDKKSEKYYCKWCYEAKQVEENEDLLLDYEGEK